MGIKQPQPYQGFEQGPIRPPSEADSLLIRVTRNCPWNRCTFCPVYKGATFSLRPIEHVIADIDGVFAALLVINEALAERGGLTVQDLNDLALQRPEVTRRAFFAGANWLLRGGQSVFLQDANSLVVKPDALIRILRHVKNRFPWVSRVTSYARSQTIYRINDADMGRIADAGLNRIHIGLESGSDEVLSRTRKGATKDQHIVAGRRVKSAGIELSEYVMPGLGGVSLSSAHAAETADALNRIDPDFIRLRTLTIPTGAPLAAEHESGAFVKCSDFEVAREIRSLIAALDGINSILASDHNNNLLPEVEGRLPDDKARMLGVLERFLALPPTERAVYQVGRRAGLFQALADLDSPDQRIHVERICERLAITPDNVDEILEQRLPRAL